MNNINELEKLISDLKGKNQDLIDQMMMIHQLARIGKELNDPSFFERILDRTEPTMQRARYNLDDT